MEEMIETDDIVSLVKSLYDYHY